VLSIEVQAELHSLNGSYCELCFVGPRRAHENKVDCKFRHRHGTTQSTIFIIYVLNFVHCIFFSASTRRKTLYKKPKTKKTKESFTYEN